MFRRYITKHNPLLPLLSAPSSTAINKSRRCPPVPIPYRDPLGSTSPPRSPPSRYRHGIVHGRPGPRSVAEFYPHPVSRQLSEPLHCVLKAGLAPFGRIHSVWSDATLTLLPEILLLETTLGLGGRPSLDVAFVAVCDNVLMALKGERRRPLPTSLSGLASARLTQNQTAEISTPPTTPLNVRCTLNKVYGHPIRR